MVVDFDGKIVAVDTEESLSTQEWYNKAEFASQIDAKGLSIIPGFVDAHTHPVFNNA